MTSQGAKNCIPRQEQHIVSFFKTMYNKTIIRFGFCDIRNNKGLDKCYQLQPQPLAED